MLAHSDVAPARKRDPGEKFPWDLLAASGVGLWVDPVPITDWLLLTLGDEGEAVRALQDDLAAFGYRVPQTGRFDEATCEVVRAFQRHFRPAQTDGILDTSTRETLRKLLAARGALTGGGAQDGDRPASASASESDAKDGLAADRAAGDAVKNGPSGDPVPGDPGAPP